MLTRSRHTLSCKLSTLLVIPLIVGVLAFDTRDAEAFNEPSVGLVIDFNVGLALMDIVVDVTVCAVTLGLACDESEDLSPVGFGLQGSIPLGDSSFSVKPFLIYYSDYSAVWVSAAAAWHIINGDSFNLYLALGPGLFAFMDEETTDSEFVFFPDVRAGIELAPAEMFSIDAELYAIGARIGFNYLF